MADNPTVAIIGAGMGGLATAAALLRYGIKANIYEQAEQFARVGAGIQMASNPMKVLRRFGLEDRLRDIAFQHNAKASRDYDSGDIRYTYDMSQVEERFGAPHLLMHRADLHSALLSLVPDEAVHLGRKFVYAEQDGEKVAVRFADGSWIEADALIAADGTHSICRELLFGNEVPHYSGRVAYRATFPSDLLGGLSLGEGTTKWWGPDRHIVIYYITRNRDTVYFTTSVPEPEPSHESWSRTGNLEKLRCAFAQFHPHVRQVLDACPETHVWPIYAREPQASWGKGRIYLLGDACHPMTPYMSQGAAMAIEDAAILARCLEGAGSADLPAALRRYEATRQPRASMVQSLSNKNVRDWMRADLDDPDAASKVDADPGWVYAYDAWSAPLAEREPAEA